MSRTIIDSNTWRANVMLNRNYIDEFKEGDIIEVVDSKGAILERRQVVVKKVFEYLTNKKS